MVNIRKAFKVRKSNKFVGKKSVFKHKNVAEKIKQKITPSKAELRQKIRNEKKAEARAEKQKTQEVKIAHIKEYKKKRLEKTKMVNKKTKRGQPIMKDRMQMLLKQIQELKH